MNRNTIKVSSKDLEDFCIDAMLKCGMCKADARTTADVLVTTDTWGIFTHGVKVLLHYLRKVRAGGIKGSANPKIIAEDGAWGIVDGDDAMAMVASCTAMNLAVEKAKSCGIAYVGVRNSCHFGAAGYYAWLAAQNDMIGLAMSNGDPNMSVPGGRWKIMGNNPIAYCIPAGREKPILFDIALSAVAAGKGEKVPEGWLTDTDGLSTIDASLYPAKACMTPMAGHKGYGFAMLVEILSAGEMGDTAKLKREFGDRLSFNGAIDTRQVLPHGTTEDVRKEVRRRLKDLAPGGGYIASAVHCIQPDVPPGNVIAMCEEVSLAGRYPLDL